MNTSRSRWAAIGAAVAVTLGAGGVGISQATTDSGDGPVSAFFPIEPCRLASNEAILADSSITLDGWGMTGDCDLPNSITGLAANVTAVGASQQTNLRFYAEGGDIPDTANLNPSPGAAPTPNAVNITLNATNGQFNVYNRFGTVGVFIDVMGYYDDHTHDDRYYTEAEIDALLRPTITRITYGDSVTGSPSTSMSKFRDIGSFESSGGVVRITWGSLVNVLGGGTCNFGIRVNGLGSAPFDTFGLGMTGTESTTRFDIGLVHARTIDVFTSLPAGTHDLDLYARALDGVDCIENVDNYAVTVQIEELPGR